MPRLSRSDYARVSKYIEEKWEDVLERKPTMEVFAYEAGRDLSLSLKGPQIRSIAHDLNKIWPTERTAKAVVAKAHLMNMKDEILKGQLTQASVADTIGKIEGIEFNSGTIAEAWRQMMGTGWPTTKGKAVPTSLILDGVGEVKTLLNSLVANFNIVLGEDRIVYQPHTDSFMTELLAYTGDLKPPYETNGTDFLSILELIFDRGYKEKYRSPDNMLFYYATDKFVKEVQEATDPQIDRAMIMKLTCHVYQEKNRKR